MEVVEVLRAVEVAVEVQEQHQKRETEEPEVMDK
jgi:hypothetical protein